MGGFSGFPRKGRLTKIPGIFFTDVLPHIDSLNELKVTLYCFWRLQRKEGNVPFLQRREIIGDRNFMNALGANPTDREAALDDGLERATQRGTLLHVRAAADRAEDDLYFVNSERSQAVVQGIIDGEWTPPVEAGIPTTLIVERPNAFTLYEQNIGPLTPLIADQLRDLTDEYSELWVEEAIQIAVQNNVRRLPYITKILERRAMEGTARPDDAPRDRDYYLSDEFDSNIEY